MRIAALLLLSTLLLGHGVRAAELWLVEFDGAIGPAVADHLQGSLSEAAEASPRPQAVVLRMNTPGGLDQAMRDMVGAILASPVPVVSYVSPAGSRAASAGTYLLYASHVAAMAPATHLGAATPVQMGGGGLPFGDDDKSSDSPDAMERKVVNDAVAYLQSLAELRGRNAEWARLAVVEGATLTAAAAKEQGVIDYVADDLDALLATLEGQQITLEGGATVTLATAGAALQVREPDWRSRFLQVITNPNIAYLLLILGIYGLIFEFSSPGIGAGGIVGGICLLLAAYSLQMLPVSYSALGLLLLGLGLLAAEAFSPSFGVLGLGGTAAFIVGSILLMDSNVPGYEIALPVILALAVSSVLMLVVVLQLLRKTRYRPARSGLDSLVGQVSEVGRFNGTTPMALLDGEWWQLRSPQTLHLHDKIRVIRAEGLVLDAEKEE